MNSRGIRRYLRHGTLPQLMALEAVARLGSVTRAAEALHLAQPTVSGHLRKLGEAAGMPVCEPTSRGVELTAAGRALLDAAFDMFEALQRADETLVALRRTEAQRRDTHAAAAAAMVQ